MSPLEERIAKLPPEKRALLEQYLLAQDKASRARIVARDRSVPTPLSYAQQRWWLMDQLDPNNWLANYPAAKILRGSLDVAALERALNALVTRHEILRTVLHVENDEPRQAVTDQSLVLSYIDLSDCSGDEQTEQFAQLMRQESERPFDLSRDLMFRAFLFRITAHEHILFTVTHHIVADAWAVGVMNRDLALLYEAFHSGQEPPLPSLPIQYADFAAWQRQPWQETGWRKELDYWRAQLEGAPASPELPTDHPRPAQRSMRGNRLAMSLPPSLLRPLSESSRAEGVTLFTTLLAAFQILLLRYTEQTDIVVGTPTAARGELELEPLVGYFINNLVMRTDLSGNPTFREALHRVRQVAHDAFANQHVPFERLVQELHPGRNLARTPLFQIAFQLRQMPNQALRLPGIEVEDYPVEWHASQYDLSLDLVETEGELRAIWEYSTDLFDEATIARMAGNFATLLGGIVADPGAHVYALPLLTGQGLSLLEGWNQTEQDFPESLCLHQLFEAQAETSPDAVAITFEEEGITYSELNRRANQLARYLGKLGAGPEIPVGICLERSIDMVVALLGVLKAGGAYVPLDPGFPPERLRYMLADSTAPILITQERVAGLVEGSKVQRVLIDSQWEEIARECSESLPLRAVPDNIAYILYTSGSTGRPKGVPILHRAVVNFLWSMQQRPAIGRNDVLLAITTISFDIAGLELFLPLSVGARVNLVSHDVASSGPLLAAALASSGATIMQATPTTWRMLLDAGWPGDKQLKMLCGGEALSVELARELLDKGGSLWNMYGPTETTIWSSVLEMREVDRFVPIGPPIANTQFYVLDSRLNRVPVGIAGDLYIGGTGLARGYFRRPELTAERFIPNPFIRPSSVLYRTGDRARYLPNGCIEFLGRQDYQVKLHGFRIELSEIEKTLREHPAISGCVVTLSQAMPGEPRLVAYITSNSQEPPSASDLRLFLQPKLPDYMIPSMFIRLDEFPLTPNRKIDRNALPAPDWANPEREGEFIAPRTDIERRLAQIWSGLLGVTQIGIYDNFFSLGGHSLLAVRMVAQIEKSLGTNLPLATVFEHPTIEQLAQFVERQHGMSAWQSLVELQKGSTRPPFFFVHPMCGDVVGFAIYTPYLGADQPFYGLRAHGLDGVSEPFILIEEMAACYIEEMRQVQPHGPYRVGGYGPGGMIAFEIAQQLKAQGEEIELLAIVNEPAFYVDYHHFRGGPRLVVDFARNLPYWLDDTIKLGGAEVVDRVLQRIKLPGWITPAFLTAFAARFHRLAEAYQSVKMDYLGQVHPGMDERRHQLILAMRHALEMYKPRPYPGRVTLIRTLRQPLFCSFDPKMGWEPLAQDGVEVHPIPGSTVTILKEPDAAGLGRILADLLHRHQ